MTRYYYVYILTNRFNDVFYVGVTNDLLRRVWEHKNKVGKSSSFTKRYKVDKLVYYDYYESVHSAIIREKQIKSWARKRKLKLITDFNPNWDDLYEEMSK